MTNFPTPCLFIYLFILGGEGARLRPKFYFKLQGYCRCPVAKLCMWESPLKWLSSLRSHIWCIPSCSRYLLCSLNNRRTFPYRLKLPLPRHQLIWRCNAFPYCQSPTQYLHVECSSKSHRMGMDWAIEPPTDWCNCSWPAGHTHLVSPTLPVAEDVHGRHKVSSAWNFDVCWTIGKATVFCPVIGNQVPHGHPQNWT